MNNAIESGKYRSYTYPRIPIEACSETNMAYRAKYLARGKMRSNNGKNYYLIFLWNTQEDYERAAKVKDQNTIALCITDTMICETTGVGKVNPKLGELHFVSGTWDVNTVAHEVTHGVIHRMRYLDPLPEVVLDELAEDYDPENEEVIAYEAGAWVESCLAWLTNIDPNSRYPKHLFDR